MRLTRDQCRERLDDALHGVLATVHGERGVDAVPVCFVVDGDRVAVPVDRVKPKATAALQRVANLDADPRAALLCDHWEPSDWSRLWWVRASLELIPADQGQRSGMETRLADKYRQYRDRPFTGLLVFRITGLTGWTGSEPEGPRV